MSFYRFVQWLALRLWALIGELEVRGLENIPSEGPFLLICNHQSYLDPILIQSVCPRPLHSMAKSTQFAAPLVGRLMVRLLSFPVRRYQVDPQAVRHTLRRLEAGEPVVIYIEGERSWDGRLQPPRLGTVRLILKAGVPVVPCAIAGAYEAWPRWAGRPGPGLVRILFGEPLHFPKLDRKADRERALPEAVDRLMGTIQAQLDELEATAPDPR